MKINQLIAFVAITAGIVFFASCGSGSFKKTDTGLEYKFLRDEKGAQLVKGDMIFYQVITTSDENDTLFDSYKNGRFSFREEIGDPLFAGDLREALAMMTDKDSALFQISIDSFYAKYVMAQVPDTLKKGSKLTFRISVDSVYTKAKLDSLQKTYDNRKKDDERMAVEKQNEEISKYIADNKLTVTTTQTGLRYVITKKASGPTAETGDTIVAEYTGRLLNGTEFDSSKGRGPFKFSLNQDQVIAGWHEIFAILHKGEKATVIIPFEMAYREYGAGQDIPPYAPLVFDVELVNIIKGSK